VSEREEIEAALYFEPLLGFVLLGKLTDSYACPRCKRTKMPRRISFDYYIIRQWEDVSVFARNFCTRCVEDETTDDEVAMYWRLAFKKTQSEIEASRDAPWRGYAPLLADF
jgi:hypothetical protein